MQDKMCFDTCIGRDLFINDLLVPSSTSSVVSWPTTLCSGSCSEDDDGLQQTPAVKGESTRTSTSTHPPTWKHLT